MVGVLKDSKTNVTKEKCDKSKLNSTNTRRQLDTEDTLRVSNLNLPDLMLDDDNPFLECHQNYSPEAVLKAKSRNHHQENRDETLKLVDCESTVSSLSEGSFKQRPLPPASMAVAVAHAPPEFELCNGVPPVGNQPPHIVPPKVICFQVTTEVPDWLLENEDDSLSPPPQEDRNYNIGSSFRTADDDTTENHPQPQLQYRRHHHGAPAPHWSPLPSSNVVVPHPNTYQHGAPPVSPHSQSEFSTQIIVQQQQQQQQQPILSPVWTGAPSPANTRPSMGRHNVVSSYSNFPTHTPRPIITATEPFPLPPCDRINVSDHAGNNNAPVPRPRASMTPRTLPPPPLTPRVLSSRHHRKHKRNASAGEVESLWTLATTESSARSPSPPGLLRHSNHSTHNHARRASPAVQELRSLWSKVRHGSNRAMVTPDLTMSLSNLGDGSSRNRAAPAHGCLT